MPGESVHCAILFADIAGSTRLFETPGDSTARREIFIKREEFPLSGTGVISLGQSSRIDSTDLIHFSCL